jgi:hypothetical protein
MLAMPVVNNCKRCEQPAGHHADRARPADGVAHVLAPPELVGKSRYWN